MAYSSYRTEIGKYLDKYILKKKLSQDEYFVCLQHACDCYREISLKHDNKVVTVKMSVTDLGIIEMPSDMVGFSNLFVPINGEWWSFTKKSRKVMTTTTTNGIEGQDSDMGEGVDVYDDSYSGISGKGGINAYYMNIDWTTRRIFCDGFKSDTAVLTYTSNGLQVSASTYVPSEAEIVIDAYLDWMRELNDIKSLGKAQYLQSLYTDRLQQFRFFRFMPTLDEIADAWNSASTLGIQR